MLKKLIALLVVAMLILPSAAGKHKSKVKASAVDKNSKAKGKKAEKKANKKRDAKDTDSSTAAYRGEGIRIAMSKIQRNIERTGEKAPRP